MVVVRVHSVSGLLALPGCLGSAADATPTVSWADISYLVGGI